MKESRFVREKREKLDRQIDRLRATNCCGVCGAPLPDTCKTSVGLHRRKLVLTTDCCAHRLTKVIAEGVYRKGGIPAGLTPRPPKDLDEARAGRDALLKILIDVDAAERWGGGGGTGVVHVHDSPWKRADREWFRAHPTRTHRLRRALDGELAARGRTAPAGKVVYMLLRQVTPTLRRALPIVPPSQEAVMAVTDSDELLAAIFDSAVDGRVAWMGHDSDAAH